MRLIFTYTSTLLLFVLHSCGNEAVNHSDTNNAAEAEPVTSFSADTLKGIYTGKLDDKTIVLNIFYAEEGHITGFNIVSGNRRNLSGSYAVNTDSVKMTLSEPGDDKNDGVFTLTMNRSNLSVIAGEWNSASGKVKTVRCKRVADKENALGADFLTWSSSMFSDSLVKIVFEPAGTCYYEYYSNSGQATEQYVKINGTFERNGSSVSISWAQANLLPKKCMFNLSSTGNVAYSTDERDVYEHQLEGMGRLLTEEIMP